MRCWLLGIILLAPFSGCRKLPPLQVHADANVLASFSPVAKAGPILPVSIEPNGACDAARIAVLDVDGLLLNLDLTGLYSSGENPVALFRERLDAICDDPLVCAVVVRINSPGGGVTATDIMWHDLLEFKRRKNVPIVACLLDLGTGGAYYLATRQ